MLYRQLSYAGTSGGSRVKSALCGLVFVLLAASSAGADWLVLKDGNRIQTRGTAVVVDGEVGYFDLTGQIRRFRAVDLDINATKLMNIAARRKRGPGEERYVIDDEQVGHVDPAIAESLARFRDAKSWVDLDIALEHFNVALDRVGGNAVKELRCKEKYPDDWGAQAMCKLGKAPPPGAEDKTRKLSPNFKQEVVQLEEASRAYNCRKLYPSSEFDYQVCLSAKN
jgi:hypothetical protein